jgi:transglutaminase-like putative cysteine protease
MQLHIRHETRYEYEQPARCVSGYFNAGDTGEVESHAWADVRLGPEHGWFSLDVTHAE